MKVFISWPGERSRELADLFRRWLPGVLQAVRPYFSPDDISKGTRWSGEIAKELSEARVGIICLTPDNLEAPWIQFEAGALSKELERSRVCPILFDLEPADVTGPLVQFQASRFEKGEVNRVVRMINEELEQGALPPDVFDSVFEMWWPRLSEGVEAILAKSGKTLKAGSKRSTRDLVEEILQLSRAMSEKPRFGEPHPRLIHSAISSFRDILDGLEDQPISTKTYHALKRMNQALRRLAAVGSPSGRPLRVEGTLERLARRLEQMSVVYTPLSSLSNDTGDLDGSEREIDGEVAG